MPQSYIEYTSGLTGTTFSVPFKYISVDDVHALGYDGTYYTSLAVASRDHSAKTITLATAPSTYTKVRVYRSTATDQLVDFQNGSRLSEADLDTAYQQGLFVAQEVSEDANTNQYVNLADAALLANTSLSEFSSSSHTGDASEVTFDLSFVPKTSLPQAFLVIIDGVLQSPVDAYTVSINPAQITFASAPPLDAEIVVTTTAAATGVVIEDASIKATGSTEPRSLSDRFADTVNVKDFGAKGDGVTDDTAAIQAALDSGCAYVVSKGRFKVGTLNIPSGVAFDGQEVTTLVDGASIKVTGSYDSEVSLTSIANSGDNVINIADASSYSAGDYLSIKSVINCLSDDAGNDRLGVVQPLIKSYFSEFVLVKSIAGNTITIEAPLLFNYTLTAGPDSGDRTASTVAKVNFVSDVSVKGISFERNANNSVYDAISFDIVKDSDIKNCMFTSTDEQGRFISLQDCLRCVASHLTTERPIYSTSSSAFNSLITKGSTHSGFSDITCYGGFQIVDFTFSTDASRARPSIKCFVNDARLSSAFEGITSHPCCYGTTFSDINIVKCERGARLRSKRDSLIGFNFEGATDTSGIGLYLESGWNDGTVVSGGTISNFLYGVASKPNYSVDEAPDEPYKSLITSLNISACSIAVHMEEPDVPSSSPTNISFSGLYITNVDTGVIVKKYNNDVIFRDVIISKASQAGINLEGDAYNLVFDGISFVNFGSAAIGIRGPTINSWISDNTTYPSGNDDAQLIFTNLSFHNVVAGQEYGSFFRSSLDHFNDRISTLGKQRVEGGFTVEQFHTNTYDLLKLQNFGKVNLFTVNTSGKLGGSNPELVKTSITSATDLAALKTALLELFQ